MKRLNRYITASACVQAPHFTVLSRGQGHVACLFSAARLQSTSSTSSAVSAQINEMFDSFAEARELIRDAMDSAGTVYFHEDMEDAMAMTEQTLTQWKKIQDDLKLSGDEAMLTRLINENELKMKQLEAELDEAKHAGGDS